jgi:hypothetical protein
MTWARRGDPGLPGLAAAGFAAAAGAEWDPGEVVGGGAQVLVAAAVCVQPGPGGGFAFAGGVRRVVGCRGDEISEREERPGGEVVGADRRGGELAGDRSPASRRQVVSASSVVVNVPDGGS